MTLSPKLLYEDDHIQLLHQEGSSEFVLATFSNYGFKADGVTLWGKRLCERENIETYGFVAKCNNWFPRIAMTSLLDRCVFSPDKPIITYGHSQGGYAALKYSAALGAAGVVAGAPQFSINPKSVPKDKRFSHHFSEVLHSDMDIGPKDLSGNIIIIFDPYDFEDAYEVDRICEGYLGSKLQHLRITNIGHSIMDVLRDRNLVLSLFSASLDGSSILPISRSARELKKSSHSYSYSLAARVLDHGRPRLALAILDALLRKAGPFELPALAARHSELRSKAYTVMRMMPEALEQAKIAADLEPGNPRFGIWLNHLLQGTPAPIG